MTTLNRVTERRSFFRINDHIGLSYSALEHGEDFQTASCGGLGLPLTEILAEIDEEFNQVSNILWHQSPAIAQALGLLNRKISIIAAHALQDEQQPGESYEELKVSLSGCGMAFHCRESLPPKTRLRVRTVLKPSNICLNFTANVVACDKLPDGSAEPYWMRVVIDSGNAAAKEQLIQHIVQKQCAQIGSKEKTVLI
jgi:hypothetical protein